MVECPRCLGKGKVDLEDIKRLKKELYWGPGKCAYCNGIGKVPPDRIEKVRPDFEYLTTDLPSWERHKVINGDSDALERAKEHNELVQIMVEEIEHLYYIENMEPAEIADYYLQKWGESVYAASAKQEIIDYVEAVIKSKLRK